MEQLGMILGFLTIIAPIVTLLLIISPLVMWYHLKQISKKLDKLNWSALQQIKERGI